MNTMRMLMTAGLGLMLAAPVMATPVAPGFATTALGRTDDGYSAPLNLGFAVNFFGTTYSTIYVSNNGYVTFRAGQGNYTPQGLGAAYAGLPIIAAFYDDVDTRNVGSGITAYGTGTYDGHAAFGATWPGVGYFSNAADKLNAFQLIITDRADTGAGNFDIFLNYDYIHWDASADTSSAAVGYNAGNGAPGSFYEAPGSLVAGAFVDNGSHALHNSSLVFNARNGTTVVVEPSSVPEPETFALLGLGVAAAWFATRRRTAAAGPTMRFA